MNARGKAFHYNKGCWTSLEFIFRLIFFFFTEQSDQILVQNICKEEHSRRIIKCLNDPQRRRIKYIMGYVDYKVGRQLKRNKVLQYIYKGSWNLALYWNKWQNTAVCYLCLKGLLWPPGCSLPTPGLERSKDWQPWVKVFNFYTSEAKEIARVNFSFFPGEKWEKAQCQSSGNGCQVFEDLVANRGRTIASLLKGCGFGPSSKNWNFQRWHTTHNIHPVMWINLHRGK